MALKKTKKSSQSGANTVQDDCTSGARLLDSIWQCAWKLYVFQKLFFRNPFFNYRKFWRKIDLQKYRNSKKYICLQVYGEKALRETLGCCRDVGVKPFLLFGTLLGHYRDGGFIEHDSDIDLGLLMKDFAKADALVDAMRKKGYQVRGQNSYGISFKKERFRGINVDFYVLLEEDRELVCMTGVKSRLGKYRYPAEIFAEFQVATFSDNIEVLIPKNTEDYLHITYGDWKTPDPYFQHTFEEPPNSK